MGTAAVSEQRTVNSEQSLEFLEVEGSSNIASRAYDPARKVIVVRYHSGSQYEYPDCDYRVWKDFNEAESAGKFVYAQLGKKAYKKLDDWK